MLHSLVFGLLISACPYWMVAAVAAESDCAGQEKVITVTVIADDEEASERAPGEAEPVVAIETMIMTTDGDDGEPRILKLRAGPGLDLAASNIVLHGVTATADKDRGWLGVQISEVPESLATQFDIAGQGVILANVMVDGPADKAGLQLHDVVILIDGEKVETDLGGLTKLIGKHKPGDEVSITILRAGKENNFDVTLGTWGEAKGKKWKFDFVPVAEIEDEMRTHGKMLFKGPGGKWVFKDLGDLDIVLEDLGDFLPKKGSRSIVLGDGHHKTCKIEINTDDEGTLIIKQENDGSIVVRRVDADGNETTNTYEDKEALEASDEDAFQVIEGVGGGLSFHIGLGDLSDIDFYVDIDELKNRMGDWPGDVEKSTKEAVEAYEEAMKLLHGVGGWSGDIEKHMEEAHKAYEEAIKHLHGAKDQWLAPDGKTGTFSINLGKPRNTFKMLEDGRIEVRLRKDDSELVRMFTNERDLARRDPKLFEKYQELKSADE